MIAIMNLPGRSAATALSLVIVLGGCSSSRELRTQGQAAGFAVEVAGGEPASDWSLAAKPTPGAAQAWADRRQIADLGRRLREEGSAWTCEFAHKSVGLGSIGSFNENDSGIETREGAAKDIDPKRVAATLNDIVTMHFREFVMITTSICGPYKD